MLSEWRHPERITADNAYGCGYPSDPKAKAWLRANLDPVFGFPSESRGTSKQIREEEGGTGRKEEEGVYVCVCICVPMCLCVYMSFTHTHTHTTSYRTLLKYFAVLVQAWCASAGRRHKRSSTNTRR